MMTVTKEQFKDRLFRAFDANSATLGTPGALDAYCKEPIADRFYALTEEMLRVNEHMNLTAITAPDEIIVKHYADCALIAPYLPANASLCDVGTGGGFPALPIAILRPDISVLAVDSTQKKLDYVAGTAALLGLSNLRIKAARAEALGQTPDFRKAFDVVTARAVARMNVLCEWCLPLVKKEGLFLAMKGRDGMIEYEEAKHAIDVLGGCAQMTTPYVLRDPFAAEETGDAMSRVLLCVKKRQFTPKQYPRANAQIAKKPL
ncbi:MAG: 16S rRNA (guanine(527)-N(7))-methyltransferase RsmG [Ruminococcaceae bacterium]|nr:16S rRNA (guanine(527)-N(7))-methyltransferase RsmG [Oscillospiraceae bacterium]